jgi:hypothetical protein
VSLVDPATLGFGPEIVVATPIPSGDLKLHRLLDSEHPSLDDFRPDRTATQALRKAIPEIHRVAISTWMRPEQALHACRQWPAYVAALVVREQTLPLARVALTETLGRGHVDIWAHPEQLMQSVTSIERYEARWYDSGHL